MDRRVSSARVALIVGMALLMGCGSAASQPPEPTDPTLPPFIDYTSPLPVATAPATIAPAPTDTVNSQVVIEALFRNSNDGGVRNGAVKPATLVLDRPATVTYVQTYHWNNGKGVKPETIMITGSDGTVYGPWQAKGTDGQGGVKNAYWEVEPNVSLPPGTYVVEDFEPADALDQRRDGRHRPDDRPRLLRVTAASLANPGRPVRPMA